MLCSTIQFYISTDPARVVFTPTIQYLPLALSGVIHCHIESHPPFQFITWTKDKRIFDPFEMEEIQTLTNGSLLITKVKTFFKPICEKSSNLSMSSSKKQECRVSHQSVSSVKQVYILHLLERFPYLRKKLTMSLLNLDECS